MLVLTRDHVATRVGSVVVAALRDFPAAGGDALGKADDSCLSDAPRRVRLLTATTKRAPTVDSTTTRPPGRDCHDIVAGVRTGRH